MNKRNIITLALSSIALGWALAQETKTSTSDRGIETKVSESRSKGKYKRTTETFRDKVLVARKEEVSVKDNGQIDYVFTKLFRDGEMIHASTFHAAAKNTVRSYYHQGKMILEEGDEDGDGFFETMIFFEADKRPVEAFSKSKDGAITPFSKDKLGALKTSFSKFQE
jgi:Trm5-related predicted tRNA methylase